MSHFIHSLLIRPLFTSLILPYSTSLQVSVELEDICQIPAKDTSELAIAILEVARGKEDLLRPSINRQVTPPPTKRFG